MTNPDSLYTLLASVLTQAKAALATVPAGVPGRTEVVNGLPAFDCEQVTVHQVILDKAPTALDGPSGALNMNALRASVNVVRLQLTVIRCVTVPSGFLLAPSAAVIDSEAATFARDQWVCWNYLQSRVRDGTLFPGVLNSKRPVRFGPCVPVTAEGGFSGFTLLITVELEGYDT